MKRTVKIGFGLLIGGVLVSLVWAQTVQKVPNSITIAIRGMDGTPVIVDYYANDYLVEEARVNGTNTMFDEYAAKSPTDPTMDLVINWVEVITKKAYHAEFSVDPAEIEYFDEKRKRISLGFELGPNGEIRAYYSSPVKEDKSENYEQTELIHGCAPKMGEGDKIFQEFIEYKWSRAGDEVVQLNDETIKYLIKNGQSLRDQVVINCTDQ